MAMNIALHVYCDIGNILRTQIILKNPLRDYHSMVSFILFGCSKEFLYYNNKLQTFLPNTFHDIGAR